MQRSIELNWRLHHVGYAVQSINDCITSFLSPLFSPKAVSEVIEDPIQMVRVAFVELPGGLVELIEPLGPESPVKQIVERRKGGLYHVCYASPQFDLALEHLVRNRCRPLGRPTPAAAFAQRRIVFVMTPYGDVFELLEEEVKT